jgi:AcrR family transcriptional regulator
VAVKRKYDSSKRQEQARATKRAIVEAAGRLFLEHGYVGTTIAAIAEEAGVAVQTVYAAFGTKVAILSTVFDVAIVGDDEPVAFIDREAIVRAQAEPDQHRRIEMFAEIMADALARTAPVSEMMRDAAAVDEAAAELYESGNWTRFFGMSQAAEAIAGADGIAMPVDEAGELLWVLAGPEVFLLLTRDRGWSRERYEAWLASTVERTIVAPAPAAARPATRSSRSGTRSSTRTRGSASGADGGERGATR